MSAEPFDILEDIHRMKSLAIEKGYALSSLVLLVDEPARRLIRRHPDYTQLCLGDEILGMGYMVVIDNQTSLDGNIFYDVVVRLGAAQYVLREEQL